MGIQHPVSSDRRASSAFSLCLLTCLDWGSDFPCDVTHSKEIPLSAHKLRPSDIKVVAALGDWITTGLGANRANGSRITTWRGLSWSIGGDQNLRKHITLPNILRKFNPWIRGFSQGTSGQLAGLNVARADARARDLPTQARDLLKKLETAPEINIETDWKLITIFIGINDLCDFCIHQGKNMTEGLVEHITETIDIFFHKLPRVFINLVEIMQVVPLYQNQGGKCAHLMAPQTDCPCFQNSANSPVAKGLKEFNQKFQEGYTDSQYFASDCFHFSSLTHNEMAIALWNNMKYPYFFTEKNSPSKRKKWWRFWILISLMLFFFPVLITTLVVAADREGILGAPGT
ncbi:phospholipase B1, membrane-associated-like [Sorex araneus]|uniref:phospholipase B1, membrane-associated-like n=1 Tax=Sorex araneus TaxID=42254 RepID=UPI0024339B5A|nr:phospholipase B1, membrane-associated-like [Sorex araneus]